MKFLSARSTILGLSMGVVALGLGAVAVKSADAAPRPSIIPYATSCEISSFDFAGRGQCIFDAVPAGYHFEMLMVTSEIITTGGVVPFSINAQVNTGGIYRSHFFRAEFQGNSMHFTGDTFVFSQPVHLTAQAGSTTIWSVVVSDATTGVASLTASGNLVLD